MSRRARLEAKAAKRDQWADAKAAESARAFKTSSDAVAGIPFGQPILVGHHSEKRHRAALKKCDDAMRRSVEAYKMAGHHASKAEGIRQQLDRSIFSDDQDAIEQLEAKITKLEAERTEAKTRNAYWRKHGTMKGCPGVSDKLAEVYDAEIPKAYSWERCPVPGYRLQLTGKEIKRCKDRIEDIKRRAARQAQAEDAGGVVVTGTGEYVRVTFAEFPGRPIINDLKAAGFHWGNGSWSGRRDAIPQSVADLLDEVSA